MVLISLYTQGEEPVAAKPNDIVPIARLRGVVKEKIRKKHMIE